MNTPKPSNKKFTAESINKGKKAKKISCGRNLRGSEETREAQSISRLEFSILDYNCTHECSPEKQHSQTHRRRKHRGPTASDSPKYKKTLKKSKFNMEALHFFSIFCTFFKKTGLPRHSSNFGKSTSITLLGFPSFIIFSRVILRVKPSVELP